MYAHCTPGENSGRGKYKSLRAHARFYLAIYAQELQAWASARWILFCIREFTSGEGSGWGLVEHECILVDELRYLILMGECESDTGKQMRCLLVGFLPSSCTLRLGAP